MAYKQNPLKYSRTSNMPGVEFADEDISMKERLATNAFGVEPPADLLDGEFFLKDNDPQDFYRTLYIKRGESLDKVVTFTDTGKAIFDGINEINLSDDEEVKGILPKKKLISANQTVKFSAINTLVVYDGNKFQEVEKDNVVSDIVSEVNEGIDLNNYFNKNTDKLNLTSQVEGVLPLNNTNIFSISFLNKEHLFSKFNIDINNVTSSTELINKLLEVTEDFCFATHFDASHKMSDIAKNFGIILNIAHNQYNAIKLACDYTKKRLLFGTLNEDVKAIAFQDEAVVTTYTTSDGTWTETVLNNGEIMLEGWGKVSDFKVSPNGVYCSIKLPKTADTYKASSATATWLTNNGSMFPIPPTAITHADRIDITNDNANGGTTVVVANWMYKGILA